MCRSRSECGLGPHVFPDFTEAPGQLVERLLLPLEEFLGGVQPGSQTRLAEQAHNRQHERHGEEQQPEQTHGFRYVGAAALDG
jgi:hypothetical protein